MRNAVLIVALMAGPPSLGVGALAQAQQQSQPVPDAPAPQPQKKPAPKASASDSNSQPAAAPPSTKNDNPFPEDVSRDAAKAASGEDTKKSTAADNPFPENVSKDAAKAASGDPVKNSTAKDNPFPEDVSRDAAKAAGNDSPPASKTDLPPGVSSSQSSSSAADADGEVVDPGRAKEDVKVGGFYLNTGDLKGALLRYQDAMKVDPTNVDAIFGLAETERMLKNNAGAAHNYQLYLDIVPNGPKAKQALKALKTIPPG
jgi:hypothetical protein